MKVDPAFLAQPLYPAYALAAISIIAVVAAHALVVRAVSARLAVGAD